MSPSSIAVERPQRLLLIAVLLALLSVMQSALQAEAYAYRFIGVTSKEPVTAATYCKDEHSGFPPNLYTSARNDAMASWMSLGSVSDELYSDTSGSSEGQGCYSNRRCIWTWRGGPFANNRMTFYVGSSYTIAQDASKNYYYNWENKYPTWFRYLNVVPSAVGYYAPTKQWRNSYYASQNVIFVCEVTVDNSGDSSSTNNAGNSDGAVGSSSSAKLQWWVILIIVIVIVVVLAIIIIVCCCCCCRNGKGDDEDDVDPSAYAMPETSDDSDEEMNSQSDDGEDVVGGGKEYYGGMPVVAASAAGTESSAAENYAPQPMPTDQYGNQVPVIGTPAPHATPTLAAFPPSAPPLGTETSSNSSRGSNARNRWARHMKHDE